MLPCHAFISFCIYIHTGICVSISNCSFNVVLIVDFLLSLEIDEATNKLYMERAIARGSKPWNRSKVMLVGEGRVGKTALCNSMMGKPFVDSESTVGLTLLKCQVRRAAAGEHGGWGDQTKPEREFEAGVAELIRSMKSSTSEECRVSVFPDPPLQLSDAEPARRITEARNSPGTTSRISDAWNWFTHEVLGSRSELKINNNNGQVSNTEGGTNIDGSSSKHSASSKSTSVTPTTIQPDSTLVMKFLADVQMTESNLILSLFDFGGQSVFNIIHHLFLTSYGVYVVVFNMEDLLDDDRKEHALNELSFWINSIVIHTLDSETGKTAPVFLAGTHKDIIANPSDHERISKNIDDMFGRNIGWPSIVENSSFCFFPVDNRIGHQDDVVADLMSKVENVLKEADYVKAPRPLTWLKAMDDLLAVGKSFLSIDQVAAIAARSGLEEDTVPYFLSFLNEMGVLLWLNETGLRDVVILDIMTFFVEPATRIICNHRPQPFDNTVHHKTLQEACRKEHRVAWEEMTLRGVVSRPLIDYILKTSSAQTMSDVVINMMLKCGLIVKLEQRRSTTTADSAHMTPSEKYLVPALLPCTVHDPSTFQDCIWKHIDRHNSCYFVFSTQPDVSSQACVYSAQLKRDCFLPKGLMERLIGKAVMWSQLTRLTNVDEETQLYQDYVVLAYGRQLFRLLCLHDINCIRLDIEGEHPLPVYNRILEQILNCISESMRSLHVTSTVRYEATTESELGVVLLSLESIREVHSNGSQLLMVKGTPGLDREYIANHYSSWLLTTDLLPCYDVFISHRWNDHDDVIVEQLYDAFLDHTVGSKKKTVQVFYDKNRLKSGRQFQREFGRALINSILLLPILSAAALQRLLTHQAHIADNVLIEWMLALECMQDPIHSKLRGIYPLMFGSRSEDGYVRNLLEEGIIDRLPEIIPEASIAIVKALLEENSVNFTAELHSRTVRSVVSELSKYMGLAGYGNCAREVSKKVVQTLEEGAFFRHPLSYFP